MTVQVTTYTLSFLLILSATHGQQSVTLPESYIERARRGGAVLELPLKDAIRLALTNNLEIAIEDFNEELNRELITVTRGFYDPVLQVEFGWNSNKTPTFSILTAGRGIPTLINKNWSAATTLRQNVTGGGSFDLGFNNNRFTTNNAFSFINPRFISNFQFSFTQPLWRGFRETSTERQLKLYNLDTRIDDSTFQQRVSEIVQQVENQYWDLVFAVENQETRRQSMKLAILQYENNQKRVNLGLEAALEITSSRAEVANREQEMIQSEVQIVNAHNGLKALLAPDSRASIWSLILIPTDRPQMQELTLTLEYAVETALKRRPELEQVRLQVAKNEVDRKYQEKEGKPKVDLVLSATSIGTSGNVFTNELIDSDGDGVPDTPGDQIPLPQNPFFGNLNESWSQVFGFDFMTYGVSFSVEIPLRNRSNEGERARVAIAERRLLSQMKNQRQLVTVDVRNAYEAIAIQKKRLAAARLATQLSVEQLEGENKRFQAGLTTNFQVLLFQRDLAQARVQELQARIDYQRTLTALKRAMFTIVEENDIVMARS